MKLRRRCAFSSLQRLLLCVCTGAMHLRALLRLLVHLGLVLLLPQQILAEEAAALWGGHCRCNWGQWRLQSSGCLRTHLRFLDSGCHWCFPGQLRRHWITSDLLYVSAARNARCSPSVTRPLQQRTYRRSDSIRYAVQRLVCIILVKVNQLLAEIWGRRLRSACRHLHGRTGKLGCQFLQTRILRQKWNWVWGRALQAHQPRRRNRAWSGFIPWWRCWWARRELLHGCCHWRLHWLSAAQLWQLHGRAAALHSGGGGVSRSGPEALPGLYARRHHGRCCRDGRGCRRSWRDYLG
mmetsp:Transcript_60905/g.115088  ORF Transcript_60905/g.115088 Transcript_60905/m.115088 type:complete len:294 (-) Transcript_60905:469-1350(-)